jgi:20S proteasome subunit alpha 6
LYEYDCFALGSRSQASKTYLEKYIDTLKECSRVELIKHAIKALGEAQQATKIYLPQTVRLQLHMKIKNLLF